VNEARAGVPTVPGLTGLSVLARGGYATVYRAVQESVGRDVAVKVENRRLADERDQRRFLREARAAGRMSGHPNVIDLFDAGMTADGHPYLIMELCEASYAERMKNGPLPAAEVRDVGVKIADALADAHALGVLHRDVKPANLLLSRFGEPQLADFGLAVLAEARDHSIILDVLTPAYASPEMLRCAPPSPAADVYALCATLYALMRGRPPRWRDDANPDVSAEPIDDVPGVPPALMAVLRAGMATDEHHRPTAVELRHALLVLDLDGGSPTGRRPVLAPPSRRPGESVTGFVIPVDAAIPFDGEITHPLLPQVDRSYFEPRGAPARPGSPDGTRRWWLWPALVAAVVAMAVVTAVVSTHLPAGRAHAQTAPTRAGCGLTAVAATWRCVETPECFGPLAVDDDGGARAAATRCDLPHAWEVFALGTVPATVTDYRKIKDDWYVRSACTLTTLALVDSRAVAWRVDVLPPTPAAFRFGDRTLRCLAAPTTGTTTGARFVKGPR
jgi:tRNA A-37 threonylcarbamoyl transferase component Bud32